MLVPAQLCKQELINLHWKTSLDRRYDFYHLQAVYEPEFNTSTWNEHEYASVDQDNNVIGLIGYSINRAAYYANGFRMINYYLDDPVKSLIFVKDVMRVIDDVFCRYGYNKLSHSVIVGNPIEKTYDKLHKRYGGRIVGTFEKEFRLDTNGQICDQKFYEITKEAYLLNRPAYMERMH